MTQHKMKKGYPIVLTASRAEANHYDNNPFMAFICTFPKKISSHMLKEHLNNLDNNKDGSAKQTIYGLRKIEAILVNEFGEENVVVSHYNNLDKFIGKRTKIVGISTMDPLGLAYVSTTYNSLIGFTGFGSSSDLNSGSGVETFAILIALSMVISIWSSSRLLIALLPSFFSPNTKSRLTYGIKEVTFWWIMFFVYLVKLPSLRKTDASA